LWLLLHTIDVVVAALVSAAAAASALIWQLTARESERTCQQESEERESVTLVAYEFSFFSS